jgi:hypothetical protein
VRDNLESVKDSGLGLLLSLRHDFSTEWAAFKGASGVNSMAVRLRKEYLPYLMQSEKLAIAGLTLYSMVEEKLKERSIDLSSDALTDIANKINGEDHYADLTFASDNVVLKADAVDVFLVIRYSLANTSS